MDNQGYSPISAVNRDSRNSLSERRWSQDQSLYSVQVPARTSTHGSEEESEPEPEPKPESPQEDPVTSAPASTELQRSFLILIIAIFYAMLALSSWIILCILSYRPLTTKSYSPDPNKLKYYDTKLDFEQLSFRGNENWYQAARVIQSITGVLTIPLTSAVCSNAAVVFIQRFGRSSNMTIRKLLALADKSWISIELYWQLLKGPRHCWRRYSTSFLAVAVALHILGGLISPLQTLFLSSKTIKIPTQAMRDTFTDIFVGDILNDSTGLTLGKIASAAIPVLRSLNNAQDYQQAWQETTDHERDDNQPQPPFILLEEELFFDRPFISLLPHDYNTGLYRQFAQRLNNTVTANFIPTSEFHESCAPDRSFYKMYNGTGWSVTACISVLQDLNGWKSPWKETRDRQDISEALYLSFNFPKLNKLGSPRDRVSNVLKITANTTSGWFELPNYMNSGKAGFLQATDPKNISAWTRYHMDFLYNSDQFPTLRDKNKGHSYLRDRNNGPLHAIEDLAAPGPLLILAYSIFGANDSFMSTCATTLNSAAFSTGTERKNIQCCSKPPLMRLISDSTTQEVHQDLYGDYNGGFDPKLEDWDTFTHWLVGFGIPQVEWWDNYRISGAIQIGLDLVYITWLEEASLAWQNAIVLQDFGDDTQIPAISIAPLAVISALLAIFLVTLLCIASYAAFSPRWTSSLDGFTMMRIGASMADRVPLLITYNADKISALDEMPGWIGSTKLESDTDDINEDHDDCHRIAKIELGSSCRLRGRQKYACYEIDRTFDDKTAK